jgi:hypothetical protein
MKAYVARTDGTQEPIDTPVSLEEAQKVVGGYVERVCPRRTPGVIFLCNEEGLIRGLPLNMHGVELYGGPIAGDIIVFRDRKAAKGWL